MKRVREDLTKEYVASKKERQMIYLDVLPWEIKEAIDKYVKQELVLRKFFGGFETYDKMIGSTADGSEESDKIRYKLGNALPGRFVPGSSVYVNIYARIQVIKTELLARKITPGSLHYEMIKFFQLGSHREMRDPTHKVIWSYDQETGMLMARDDPNAGHPGFEGMFINK